MFIKWQWADKKNAYLFCCIMQHGIDKEKGIEKNIRDCLKLLDKLSLLCLVHTDYTDERCMLFYCLWLYGNIQFVSDYNCFIYYNSLCVLRALILLLCVWNSALRAGDTTHTLPHLCSFLYSVIFGLIPLNTNSKQKIKLLLTNKMTTKRERERKERFFSNEERNDEKTDFDLHRVNCCEWDSVPTL